MDDWKGESGIDNFFQVTDAEGADTDALQLPGLLEVAYGTPRIKTRLWTSNRTMDQIQIDVSEATLLERCLNGLGDSIIAVVVLQLGRVEDVGPWNVVLLAEVEYSASALLFILVPLC